MNSTIQWSIIIPVFNRPGEINELLESLLQQTFQQFEIVIVEDGSEVPCRTVVKKFTEQLDIKYFAKANSGPGQSRNYGAERASGNYFIFFDSDCIIPPQYMEIVNNELTTNFVDAYGGPDMAHESFTPLQKAINYSMTSFFTTGGIRGGKERFDKFHPRSFNMGFSEAVLATTHGFSAMRFGEDVDMSLRILSSGFKTRLIPEAAVYHKRRTDLRKFFKQVHNSGIARINLYKRHPASLKILHFMPAGFTLGTAFLLVISLWQPLFLLPLLLYAFMVLAHATWLTKSLLVGLLAVESSFVQLMGYGSGFIIAFWKRIIAQKGEFHAFTKNFYT